MARYDGKDMKLENDPDEIKQQIKENGVSKEDSPPVMNGTDSVTVNGQVKRSPKTSPKNAEKDQKRSVIQWYRYWFL